MRARMRALLVPLLSVVAVLVVWQIVSMTFFPPVLFPTPVMVGRALVTELTSGRLVGDVLASLGRIVTGFVIGCSIGAATGLLMGFIPFARRFLDPWIQFGRFVPSISLLSPALIWLPASLPATETSICSGMLDTSASICTVFRSWVTRVPGAASPVTTTWTSTWTFSPRLMTSRSTCSM